MRTMRGIIVLAAFGVAATLAAPAEADGPQSIPYVCHGPLPPFEGPLAITTSDSVDPASIYQPLTWRIELGLPATTSPLTADSDYFRIVFPIPAGVDVQSATAVAAPGETPNPPLSDISVVMSQSEVVVDLPKSAARDATHRIRTAENTGTRTYPESESVPAISGQPVVLPDLVVTGVAVPGSGGRHVRWSAPTIDTEFSAFDAAYSCYPDLSVNVLDTTIGTGTQLCDGRPVTVQLGFNEPTSGTNVIQGTAANDTVNALGGADRFCGLGGVDTFNGGPGNDRAVGGEGNDRLRGDAGDDRLQGDAGADNLQGGDGNDTLVGGTQSDVCNGGPQIDSATTCEVRQNIP